MMHSSPECFKASKGRAVRANICGRRFDLLAGQSTVSPSSQRAGVL